jgi:hypothetical protein
MMGRKNVKGRHALDMSERERGRIARQLHVAHREAEKARRRSAQAWAQSRADYRAGVA